LGTPGARAGPVTEGDRSGSQTKGLEMKIAILPAADVSGWYGATLMERGHKVIFGPFGYVPGAVASMIKDGIDGVLILTDDDENLEEIAARFT
jgi:hypothetical protein